MKYLIALLVMVSATFAFADQDTMQDGGQDEITKIYIEAEGRLEPFWVETEALHSILSLDRYECRLIEGRWKRCYKNKDNNSCFGTSFSHKFLCEDALKPSR